jgi:hypothetical protein
MTEIMKLIPTGSSSRALRTGVTELAEKAKIVVGRPERLHKEEITSNLIHVVRRDDRTISLFATLMRGPCPAWRTLSIAACSRPVGA